VVAVAAVAQLRLVWRVVMLVAPAWARVMAMGVRGLAMGLMPASERVFEWMKASAPGWQAQLQRGSASAMVKPYGRMLGRLQRLPRRLRSGQMAPPRRRHKRWLRPPSSTRCLTDIRGSGRTRAAVQSKPNSTTWECEKTRDSFASACVLSEVARGEAEGHKAPVQTLRGGRQS